jgi:5-methyltetrahydropteroyltriglutamate--homocysteine methyltransferase
LHSDSYRLPNSAQGTGTINTHVCGYPRIGRQRELKFALEAYWKGSATEIWLEEIARTLRALNWARQEAAGLAFLTAGDFSLYDHVLDHAVLLGCLPARFELDPRKLSLQDYFVLARGNALHPAMEITKWFDTNYHYLVPELGSETRFDGGPDWYFSHVAEALARGQAVKPVLIGPITFLRLASGSQPGFDRMKLLSSLCQAYARILRRLKKMGVNWVQIDEPVLGTDLDPAWLEALGQAYAPLAEGPQLLLTTYFGGVGRHVRNILALPIHGIHIDLVRDLSQLKVWLAELPENWVLSAGIIDGRNIWRADLRAALARLGPAHDKLGDRLWIAPSCSLLHVPISLADEKEIDAEVRPWLVFAEEKLDELRVLQTALKDGEATVKAELDAAEAALNARRTSSRLINPAVRSRLASLSRRMTKRSPFDSRIRAQRAHLKLPLLPTTTIGSFPQTAKIRAVRAKWRKGQLGEEQYEAEMRGQIRHAVERQEALGLDVLVHGEPERSDMVEYFAARLEGFTLSSNGWVQSWGSGCSRPPIIFGDVYRPSEMTVTEVTYAQSLTKKPMKAVLTGPVTLLQWSFEREDQPRSQTAEQIALAIRDEVTDLERAGIRLIQIDEPALRQALPLFCVDSQDVLDWPADAFRLSTSGVQDETQIHSHICYSDFNDILPSIMAMDADVITIEAARSRMKVLNVLQAFEYKNDIGLGVYDTHSPRIPSVREIMGLLDQALQVIRPERMWVNPDCGIKTRGWAEAEASLANMVEAARCVRDKLVTEGSGKSLFYVD